MDDLDELVRIFSTPRPNGSSGARRSSRLIQEWLHSHEIPFRTHKYTQYPYFFEASGIWLILTRLFLALAAWLAWGWWTPVIALAGLLGGTIDSALHLPLVTWPGKCTADNILIEVDQIPDVPPSAGVDTKGEKKPAPDALHPSEILICAHYDSKTELLDHRQRMFFLVNIPTGILLTILVGAAGALQAAWGSNPPGWGTWIYWISALLSLPLAGMALVFGLNLSLGRLVQPSPGAVDDGAACVILLRLADKLFQRPKVMDEDFNQSPQEKIFSTNKPIITIALFSGEEIDRQGSRAYTNSRVWTGREVVLNLEAMAQNGEYVTWQKDGSVYHLHPTDPVLEEVICRVVKRVTGKSPIPGGPVLSDAASFIEKGLSCTVLGTYDHRWGDKGFHRPSDNLERIAVNRIDEGVEILLSFIEELTK